MGDENDWTDHGDDIITVQIAEGITSVAEEAFAYCSNISSVSLPSTITEIGDDSFRSCEKLKSIDIPGSVTDVGENAFYSTGLTTATIGEGVTEIWDGTFAYCETYIRFTP